VPADVNNFLGNTDFVALLDSQQNTKLETLERIKTNLGTPCKHHYHLSLF
jgi:hypothetical protein